MSRKYGIDLIIAGHSHFQKVYYLGSAPDQGNYNLQETAWTITGGLGRLLKTPCGVDTAALAFGAGRAVIYFASCGGLMPEGGSVPSLTWMTLGRFLGGLVLGSFFLFSTDLLPKVKNCCIGFCGG